MGLGICATDITYQKILDQHLCCNSKNREQKWSFISSIQEFMLPEIYHSVWRPSSIFGILLIRVQSMEEEVTPNIRHFVTTKITRSM